MRTPTGAPASRFSSRAALLAALLGVVVSGCATLRATVSGYEVGPNGLARPQQRLREALVRADFPAALAWSEDDELLRALMTGASSYYASQFVRSAAVLDSAALIADDRITASVSRNGLSLLTNEMARPYQARRTERLFIPYYGMLAYARLEQWEDAAVEARRLSALLTQYAADRSEPERATHATLHYLAGAVFERAGERGEAQVAYRLARALAPEQVDSMRAKHVAGEGDVLVVVERGFVAHRATQSISVMLGESERDSLRDGDDDSHARAATRIAERIASSAGPRTHGRGTHHDDNDDDGEYWLSVAFPSLRRSPRVSAGDGLLYVDSAAASTSRISTIIDDAASADAQRERTEMLARAVVRATAKYVVTKAVKDKKGEVAGTIANIGAALLERADIRSWHVLPQEITLLRVRVPAGQHHVQLALGGERIDVGPVNVKSGAVAIAAVRVWHEPTVSLLADR